MSVSRTSNYTPRSSASHGRIVTQNSSLSAALLREKSEGVVDKGSRSASVNPTALDVVSSDVNAPPVVSNPDNNDSSVQYVVVSKSRLSLNHASNTESQLHANDTNSSSPPHTHTERVAETYRKEEPDEQVQHIQAPQVKDSIEHNRYAYHSLKKSGRVSVNNTHEDLDGRKSGTKTSLTGDGDVSNKVFGKTSDSGVLSLTAESNNQSVVGIGDPDVINSNNSAYLNSRSSSHSREEGRFEQGKQSNSTLTGNKPDAHEARLEHQHRLDAHQHTRLSLNSHHDRVSRDRVPLSVNPAEKSVPPLDLSCLTPDKAPSEHSDSDSDILISSKSQLQVQFSDQKLHASDRNSSVLHFSAHEYNQTATGRKTYEVESPFVTSQLPHVKSSENFSGEPDTYRDERRQDPLPLQESQDRVEPTRSDLADDLNIPYQFDTQANTGNRNSPRPPSPPVQTTPPPQPEPATSLHSKSNSTVYAVANPEVLRAQGISPPPGGQYVANPSRRSDHAEVRFDSASRQQNTESRSPIRDRAPTPYARTPSQNNSEAARGQRKESLPPQHPPLDTKHNTPKPDTLSRKNSVNTVKRVYVESPSFTREEEDEYRFVNSRLEDIEDKDKTYREMDVKQRGYGGDDMNYSQGYQANQQRDKGNYNMRQGQPRDNRVRQEQDRYEDRNQDQHDRRNRYGEENRGDRYDDRNRDQYVERNNERYDNRSENRYEDRNNERYNDKNRERYDDRNLEREKYDDRNREREKYDDRNREREKYGTQPQDRYVDRNNEINGYDRNRQRDNDRYEDREKYDRDSYEQERYDRLHDERARYEREENRDPEPDFNRYQKQNTDVVDEQDLRKEKEYQHNLKKRIDNQKVRDKDSYMESLRHQDRNDYDKENFARDSLDYQEDRETGRGDPRDSVEYNGYAQRNQDWENPPQNTYQENGYSDNPQYSQYPEQQRESSKPDFYDEEDVARMEALFPKPPKYDYVENNKEDYGMQPKKSYRDIVQRKRIEEEKLDSVFITPKVPPKGKGKAKKAYSAQPEHMGHQRPVQNQFPLGFKPSSAEELWAKKAAVLTVKKESAGSSKPKGSAGKPPKWNINSKVSHPLTYKPPVPMANQGQAYKPVGLPGSREQGWTTPTRNLQPMENKPAPPTSTEMVPTAVQPQSPFRRHMELKPITQEILTEDGQRISVDINLRLISPPPQHSGQASPSHQQQQQQQQLALLPVQETQGQYMDDQSRAVGMPYQMQDPYAYDMGYSNAYQEQDMTHTLPINDVEQQISAEELALTDPSGYSKKYQSGTPRTDANTDDSKAEDGYAAQYHRNKNKDMEGDPWYKVYNLNDYKKMLREVRLNRGTLGPDLDTEPYKEKLEKRHRQFEYARNVMEKNRMELGGKKQPNFPRSPPKQGEENVKRKAALDYAKNVPKPTVKARPNQYNSYEVSAQLSQGGLKSPASTAKATPPPSQTVDVIDIRTLEQRHIAEKKNADKIRQNMDSVLSQKAH